MKTTFMALMMMFSFSALADLNKECSGEIVVPSLSCINPMPGADVRLYIMEFQTCQDEKITELDRSISGMNVVSRRSVDDIHSITAENIEVTFAEERVLIDAHDRVDNLSFQMPTDVKMTDGDQTIQMKITTKKAPDYEGASSRHFTGSFKVVDSAGKVTKNGKLACFVTR